MGFKIKKLLKTGVRAVAAYYTAGASEAMLAANKRAKAGLPPAETPAPDFGSGFGAQGLVAQGGFNLGQSIMQSVMPGGAVVPSAPSASMAPTGGLSMALPAIFGGAARVGGIASRFGIGAVGRAAAGLVRTAAGKVRGVFLASGRFISSKKGAALAKRVGLDAAAVALGVTTVEVAEMVMASQESARRGRGLSARDMRVTKRTIRTIDRLHDQIVKACRGTMPPRRSFAPRAAACPPVRLVKVK